jgi:hypothetical protein
MNTSAPNAIDAPITQPVNELSWNVDRYGFRQWRAIRLSRFWSGKNSGVSSRLQSATRALPFNFHQPNPIFRLRAVASKVVGWLAFRLPFGFIHSDISLAAPAKFVPKFSVTFTRTISSALSCNSF